MIRLFFCLLCLGPFGTILLGQTPTEKPSGEILTIDQKKKLNEREQLWEQANTFKAEAKWEEALGKLNQVLDLEKEVFGSGNAAVAATCQQMAEVHENREDFLAASKARAQALTILTKIFGETHWKVVDARLDRNSTDTLHKLTADQRRQLVETDRWMTEARKLNQKKKYQEALELASKSHEACLQLLGKRERRTIAAQSLMAVLYQNQKNYAQAEPLYDQVLEMHRQVLGEKHPAFAQTLHNTALFHHFHTKYYAQAEPLYKKALEIRRQVLGDHADTAQTLHNLGMLWANSGDAAGALAFYEQALTIRKKILGDHADTAWTLNNLADIYYYQGDYAKAEPLFKQTLEIRQKVLGEKNLTVSTSLQNLGRNYWCQGDYAKAEPLLKEALEIRRQVLGEKTPYCASSLNDLALLYQDQGDYAKAEPFYKQSMEIYRQVNGEKDHDFAQSLNNLARVYRVQGDYAKAEPLFEQAMEIQRQVLGENHPNFALSLNNLAYLYQEQGNYAKAEPLHKQALEIRRRVLGENHPNFAQSLNNLARLYWAQNDHTKAEPLFEQALEIRRRILGEKHPSVAISLNDLANLYHDQGDYAKAEPLGKKALEIRGQVLGEKHPDFALSLNNLALLYYAQRHYAKAELLSRQSVMITREHLERTSLVQSERQQFAHRESVEYSIRTFLRITAKLETSSMATYDVLLSWKGSVTARQRLTRLARTSLASDPAAMQLFEELDSLSRQIAAWTSKPPTQLPKSIDLAKKLAALANQREEVEVKLSTRAEAFRRFRQSQKLTAAELQKHLPEGTVLIDFVVYGENLAAFVVTRDQVQRVELGQARSLAEAVVRFRATMKRTTPLQGTDDPARVLRARLLDPLDRHLAGAKLVLIAPDVPLNALPFAALPGKKEGKYLIEEIALAVLPVPQMLPELLAKRDPARAKVPPSLLAIGDVDFDGAVLIAKETAADAGAFKRRREGSPMKWERLYGTRGEVLAIEDTFRKAVPQGKLTVLREGQPTEAAVRRLAPQHEFLHFATHGFFAPQSAKSALPVGSKDREFANDSAPKVVGHHPGLLSGIALAGANKPKDDDDGVLTALEVSELDLTKVELVVLSACETGLGEVAGGEGVLGLQRAFQTAGARTTVTSLWKINDLATSKLMERFYENYWKKEMGSLEALCEAQRWMLREGVPRGLILDDEEVSRDARTPPYYWAAFVLSGDWR